MKEWLIIFVLLVLAVIIPGKGKCAMTDREK